MINNAFQDQKDHYDQKFAEVRVDIGGLDSRMGKVENRLERVENRLEKVENKLDHALYTDMVKLEARVVVIEDKTVIKPA